MYTCPAPTCPVMRLHYAVTTMVGSVVVKCCKVPKRRLPIVVCWRDEWVAIGVLLVDADVLNGEELFAVAVKEDGHY